MTNKFKSAALAATAVLAIGLSATSASAATTAQGNATANIVGALNITNSGGSLNFGTIVPGAAGGNVVVTTGGALSSCGGNTCYGTTDAQDFAVTGTAGQTVVVSHPASISLNSGANSMTVSLVDNASGGAGSNTFVMPVGGYTLSFGGTLAVAAGQAAGVYGAVFDVDVAYQ